MLTKNKLNTIKELMADLAAAIDTHKADEGRWKKDKETDLYVLRAGRVDALRLAYARMDADIRKILQLPQGN